jgi:hypothetical protein
MGWAPAPITLMRTGPIAIVLLVAFAPVGVAAPAWAQTAAGEATTDLAREQFKEGVAHFDKGEFELARASFLQAYTLRKHPAILGNLAWSCFKSGHFLEAHRYFEQFLSDAPSITPAQRADVADGLNQTDAHLGHIEIAAAAGSDVSIDGEHVGTAPLPGPVAVDAGTHALRAVAPDGTASTQSVTVVASEKKVAQLAAAPPASPRPESTASAPEPAPESQPSSVWPENMLPIYIGGGLVIVSAAVAIGGAVAKQSAQSNANTEASELAASHATCPAPSGSTNADISACTTYANDNHQWNQDSTLANVAIGVGIVALVGTGVYWVLAKKQGTTTEPAAAMGPKVAPLVGPSFGGLSVSAAF